MIHRLIAEATRVMGKPRASGDDPAIRGTLPRALR